MVLIFLHHVVDTGQRLGTLQRDMLKLIVVVIIAVQTHLRAYPEVAVSIREEERDDVVDDGRGLGGIVQIVGKAITVVFVQTIFRTYPDIAGLVLTDARYLITR